MRRPLVIAIALFAACTDDSSFDEGRAFITLPPDFTDNPVATVGSPTALAFTPDARLLITTQPGKVRVVVNGALLSQAALDLGSRLCTNSERGLLGLAIDPDFATNRYVYFFYTVDPDSNGVDEESG
jgi:glucose/arabinose dehydrogenase